MKRGIHLIIVISAIISTALIVSSCEDTRQDLVVNDTSGFIFDDSQVPQLETKRMASGHILIAGEINGNPGWFMVDTGTGANIISNQAAKQFGKLAENQPEIELESASGSEIGLAWVVDELVMGPLTIKGQTFVSVDLSALRNAWGLNVLAIIGSPTLQHVVVEIDLASPRISLFDPTKYAARELVWREAKIVGGQLHVEVIYNGLSGEFRIDTGSTWNGILHSPTVARHGFLEENETTLESTKGAGTASLDFRAGTLKSLKIWQKSYENIPFNFAISEVGAFASDDVTGNIGAGIVADFLLIIDYSNSRYLVIPK